MNTGQKPDESIRIHTMVQDMLRNFGGNSDRILTAAKQLEMRTGVKTFWELGWYPAASEMAKLILNGFEINEVQI
jgi:hypothetical protein